MTRLALTLVLLSLPAAVLAQEPCATPFKAVDSLLYWLQPEHNDPAKAARCLDLSREESPEVGPLRARQILDILDAKALFVVMDDVPQNEDHLDIEGRTRFLLFPRRQPELYVEKVGTQWLWSAATVSSIVELHAAAFAIDLHSFEERLPDWARWAFLGMPVWKLLALLFMLFGAAIVRTVVSAMVVSQVRRVMRKLGATWGDKLLAKVAKPVGTLAAAGALAMSLPELHLSIGFSRVLVLFVRVLAAFSIVWLAYRLIDLLTHWLEAKAEQTETKLDDQLVPLIRTALKVFTVAVGLVFVLQNLDVDVGGLLAGLGIGGLAFALAAQDTVKNLFGALTIFLDRPFAIGDWVIVAGTEGVVERVGFRSTAIRTFYNSLITVPNATIADSTVDNFGAREYRRVKTTLGVTYDTSPEQMQAFVEGIRAILQAHPLTRKDYYEIHFRDFGAFSLDIMIYFFLKVPGWSDELRARHEIFLEIIRLAKTLHVDFAFPTQTLHVESLATSKEMAARETPAGLKAIIEGYGPGGASSTPDNGEITGGYFSEGVSPRDRRAEADQDS